MEKRDVLQYIKEHNLSSKEILNLLGITSIEDNLQSTIEGKTIKLRGIHTNYEIVFDGNFYVVTKYFGDFMYREWHGYDGFVMHKQTTFNVDNEQIIFEQLYDDHKPEQLSRYLTLNKPGDVNGRPSFRKYMNIGRMFGSSESYVEVNTNNSSRRHRVIRDQNNYIISNYRAVKEDTSVAQIASICSVNRPSILSYTMPVTNPDQLSELSDIKCPVVKIAGEFTNVNPLDDVRVKPPKVHYQLMIEKNKNRVEAFLTLDGIFGKETHFCACPSVGTSLLAEDIDALMEQFSKSGFYRYSDIFPLEATIVEELYSIKEGIVNDSVTDDLDSLLAQDSNYEKTIVGAYNNIRAIYDSINELSHNDLKQKGKV